MHLRTLSLSFVLLLLGFAACLAQQPTGPATLENLLLPDKAQKPAAAGVGPKRFVGSVVRPQDGVQHPDLDKGWAVYDASAAKAAESIKAAISKQFDAATAKGGLDAAEKWQATLEKFEKTGELPTEKEAKTAVNAAVADYKKAKDELSKAYEGVVTALTMEKKITEAKAVRDETQSLVDTPAKSRNVDTAAEQNGKASPDHTADARKRTGSIDSAMVCPELGRECVFHDGHWSGKWVRRGNTNVFDCEMLHGPAQETANYVATITVENGKVLVRRDKYRSTRTGVNPPGGTCEWAGSLSDDGKEVRWGTQGYFRSAK